MSSNLKILAVGAAGPFAGLVVPELAKRGAKVRGLVQDVKQGDEVRKHGAAEIVVGDLANRASMDAALKGVDMLFYIAPVSLPNEVEVGRSVIDAAKHAGVRRVVFSATIQPIIGAGNHQIPKAAVEELILESNMEFTFLHPAMFFQNTTVAQVADVAKSGVFSEPWSTKTRFSRVDYRDVAEVAAIALTEDRLMYGTYELCADGHLNRDDVALLMADVLGRKVTATKTAVDLSVQPAGLEAQRKAAFMKAMFDWYDDHGLLGNSLILRAVLGREPRTLRSYLEEIAVRQPMAVGAAP